MVFSPSLLNKKSLNLLRLFVFFSILLQRSLPCPGDDVSLFSLRYKSLGMLPSPFCVRSAVVSTSIEPVGGVCNLNVINVRFVAEFRSVRPCGSYATRRARRFVRRRPETFGRRRRDRPSNVPPLSSARRRQSVRSGTDNWLGSFVVSPACADLSDTPFA